MTDLTTLADRVEAGTVEIAVGDRVIVHPGPAAGLEYHAIVERLTATRATVRPVDVALSKPAWCNSRRARSVRLSMLSRAHASEATNV